MVICPNKKNKPMVDLPMYTVVVEFSSVERFTLCSVVCSSERNITNT